MYLILSAFSNNLIRDADKYNKGRETKLRPNSNLLLEGLAKEMVFELPTNSLITQRTKVNVSLKLFFRDSRRHEFFPFPNLLHLENKIGGLNDSFINGKEKDLPWNQIATVSLALVRGTFNILTF